MPKARKALIYKGFSALGKDEVTGSNPVISSRLTPLWDHPQRSFFVVYQGFRGFVLFRAGWLVGFAAS